MYKVAIFILGDAILFERYCNSSYKFAGLGKKTKEKLALNSNIYSTYSTKLTLLESLDHQMFPEHGHRLPLMPKEKC